MVFKKIFYFLISVVFLFACKNGNADNGDINSKDDITALEQVIQLDAIPLFQTQISNPKDTVYVPISDKYNSELKCIKAEKLIMLSKFIDTLALLDYSKKLNHPFIDTGFKYFSNVKLFKSQISNYYLSFSKPLFFVNNFCLIEVDYNGFSGKGFLYLLY